MVRRNGNKLEYEPNHARTEWALYVAGVNHEVIAKQYHGQTVRDQLIILIGPKVITIFRQSLVIRLNEDSTNI